MENNLDNFFKKKFDQREIEMEDIHWANMEQMIEADEQDNRKGFLWKWLLGALLLIAVAGGLWMLESSDITDSDKYAQTNVSIGNVEPKKSIDEIKVKNNNTIASSEIATTNIETNKKNSTTVNQSSENISDKSKSTQNLRNTSKYNNSKITESNKVTNTTNETIISTIREATLILTTSSKSIIEPNATVPLQQPLNTQINTPNSSTENIKESIKTEILKNKPIANLILDFPTLDLFSSTLTEKEADRKEDLPDLEWLNLKKKSRWSFGMTAGLVSDPFDNNQSNALLGAKFGLTTKYQLRKKIALNADLIYFFRGGNYQPTALEYQDSYSFGRSLNRFELTPKNTHYLELPIYLTYSIGGRHLVEGGVSASYLLGIRGFTKLVREEGPSESINDPHWISKNDFKEVIANVMLGYQYKINSNLHFGVRGVYSPGGLNEWISDPQSASLFNPDERLDSPAIHSFHLNFRLTQYFGN